MKRLSRRATHGTYGFYIVPIMARYTSILCQNLGNVAQKQGKYAEIIAWHRFFIPCQRWHKHLPHSTNIPNNDFYSIFMILNQFDFSNHNCEVCDELDHKNNHQIALPNSKIILFFLNLDFYFLTVANYFLPKITGKVLAEFLIHQKENYPCQS